MTPSGTWNPNIVVLSTPMSPPPAPVPPLNPTPVGVDLRHVPDVLAEGCARDELAEERATSDSGCREQQHRRGEAAEDPERQATKETPWRGRTVAARCSGGRFDATVDRPADVAR